MADARIRLALEGVASVVGGLGQVNTRMADVSRTADMVRTALDALGVGLSVAAFAGMVKGAIDAADNLRDMAQKTGIAVESLNGLGFAAGQAGGSLESMVSAAGKLNKSIAEAAGGNKETAEAFKVLGISVLDVSGNLKKADVVMTDIADQFEKYQDGPEKAALALKLFGKAGADMIPVLNDGGNAMRENIDYAKQYSGATSELSDASDNFNDTLGKLTIQKTGFANAMASEVMPILQRVAEETLGAAEASNKYAIASKFVRTVLETFLIAGSEVAFVFKSVGTEIGGIMAQLDRLAHADLKGFSAISDAMKADAKLAREEHDKFIADILNRKLPTTGNAPDAYAKRQGIGEYTKPTAPRLTSASTEAANAAASAIKKEQTAYESLITTIGEKIAAGNLELLGYDQLSESQKLTIKLDEEIKSGKNKVGDAHIAVARAKIIELAAIEKVNKASRDEKEVAKYIEQNTLVREASIASLGAEYAMYGKSSDARDIAMIGIKNETELGKFLLKQKEDKKDVTKKDIENLTAEAKARTLVEQATLAQSKALGYAYQLSSENKKFAAEAIFDEKGRAAALLQIDAAMWQDRIALAGDGTEAQKILQTEYSTWYENQLAKPQIDANRKMWESIDQTAHDTFISIFDSGKSAFDRLRDTLKNGLLDLLYQMTIKKWIFSIGAVVTGSAASGVASAATGSSGIGDTVSMVSGIKNAYSAITNGFSGLSTSVAGGVQAGMNALGFGGSSIGSLSGNAVGGFSATAGAPGAFTGAGTIGFTGTGGAGAAAAPTGAFAQGVGTAAGYAGGMAAGKMIGSAISGQYSIGGHGSAVVNVSTVIGAVLGGPIGGAIGGAVGGLLNRAFGMGPKKITSQGLRGTLADSGAIGESYANWKKDGGWFRSDKKDTDKTPFSQELIDQFSRGFSGLKTVSLDFAKSLGLSADALKDYSKTFDITLTADAAKNQEAIAKFFTDLGDEIATKLAPNIADFAKNGELSSATLQRLSTSLSAVNGMFDTLNVKLYDVSLAGGDMASKLVDLFGSLEAMQKVSGDYFSQYYSEQEKVDIGTRQLSKTFADLGFAMPAATEAGKAQLRAQIESELARGEAGQKEAVQLIGLTGAFAQLSDATGQLAANAAQAASVAEQAAVEAANAAATIAQAAIEAAKAQAAQAASLYFGQIDYSNNIARLTGESGAALDKFFGAVADTSNANLAAAQSANAAAKSAGDNWRAIAGSIRSALDSIQSQTGQIVGGYADSLTRFQSLTVLARGGDADSASKLSGAAQAFLTASEAKSATMADYLRDRYKVENSLTETLGSTAALASAQDLIAQNTAATVGQLTAMNATLTGFAADLYDVLQKGYAGADRDTASSVGATLATAEADYANWFNVIKEGTSGAWGKGTMTAMADGIGRYDDASGATLAYVRSSESLLDAAKRSPELRAVWEQQYGIKLPAFAVGTNFIPSDMPAMVHQGERIIPAADNRELMARLSSPQSNNAELVAEIRALRQEVADLKSLQREGNASVRQLADQFDEVSEGGNSIRTAITEDMTK